MNCRDCQYRPSVFDHQQGNGCRHPAWNPKLVKPCPVDRGLISVEEARRSSKEGDEAKINQELATLLAFQKGGQISGRVYKALWRAYRLLPNTKHHRYKRPISALSDKELLEIPGIGTGRLQEIRRLFPSPD